MNKIDKYVLFFLKLFVVFLCLYGLRSFIDVGFILEIVFAIVMFATLDAITNLEIDQKYHNIINKKNKK